jgi:hypothetical protein
MTTLRQIMANQANAARSTGPRTPAGKEQSRRNALKHGLAGAGIVLPDDEAEAVAQRKTEWHSALRPWNQVDEWLADQVVVASVQIDRCRAHETLLRAELAERAGTSWDDDRRLAAEVLAAGLSRKPSLVSRQLQQSPQGCDWMIERWEGLGRILEAKGEWTGAQKALALDLLGTPPELRDGPTRLDPVAPGDDVRAHRAAVVAGELARLKQARNTVLADLDAREQVAAELGMELEPPRPLSLLRRYAADCQRRFRWAFQQLQRGRNTTARPARTPTPVPSPASVPAPAVAAPFDARLVPDDAPEDDLDEEALLGQLDRRLLAVLGSMRQFEVDGDLDILDADPELTPEPAAPTPAPATTPAPTEPCRASSQERRSLLAEPVSRLILPPTTGNRRARRAQASQARRA